VQAVQSLVRGHRRQYDGFLLEALLEYDRLFGRGERLSLAAAGA